MADVVLEQTIDCAASCLCAVCVDPVKDARLLSCLHSFCKTCIDDVHLTTAHGCEVSCPLCRTHTRLPENGAAGLPKDITRAPAKREFECETCKQDNTGGKPEAWCKKCDYAFCKEHVGSHLVSTGHTISTLPDRGQSLDADQEKAPLRLCSQHHQPLRYFCKKCQASVCGDCVVLGEHVSHKPVVTMNELSEELHQRIRNKMDRLESEHLPRLERSLSSVAHVSSLLSSRADRCRTEIRAAGKRAVDTVLAIVEQKIIEVDDIETVRLKELDEQEDELKRHLDNMKSCLTFSRAFMKKSVWDRADAVGLLFVLDKRAESLEMVTIADEPVQHAGVGFLQPHDDVSIFLTGKGLVGEVLKDTASALHSRVHGHEKYCLIGSSVDFVVVAYNHKGKQLKHGGDEVEVKIPDDSYADGPCIREVLDLNVTDHRNGTYLIACTPHRVGKYAVEVSINGEKMQERLSLDIIGKPAMRFDREDCDDDLIVRDDQLTVMCTHSNPNDYSTVLSTNAMETGQHTWKARVQSAESHRNKSVRMTMGIDLEDSFTVKPVCYWSGSSGTVWMLGRVRRTRMSGWKADDILQLDLDCDNHIVHITNLRNGESDEIDGLPTGKLVASFGLKKKNDSITLVG